ncbi:hypothetical protein ACFVH6_41435 [Spirillospora sp. NPDC127200]
MSAPPEPSPAPGPPRPPERPRASGTPAPDRNSIGIWGAPQSGKTTFLAALRTAMNLTESGWRLDGLDEESVRFLAESTHELTEERKFPSATAQLEQLSWRLTGTREVREKRKRRLRPAKTEVRREPTRLRLDFVDPPGRLFDSQPAEPAASASGSGGPRFATGGPAGPAPLPGMSGDQRDRLVRHLAACGGLVYLLDPTRERQESDSYRFFNRTILDISRYAPDNPRDHYLPHHLAVCITKYDHFWVRDIARQGGYESVSHADKLFPTVHEDLAERFFEELCQADRVGNADAVRREIRQHFAPERTRYFVTSAVGFYLDPATGHFNDDDYSNLVKRSGPNGAQTMHLKGKVNPINVLEPVMWLVRQLTRAS